MTRNLKALGLALVAALALAALGVSTASATNPVFHSEAEHTTIFGEQEGRNTFQVNAGTIHCETAKFHGTATQKTTTEIIVNPVYGGCKITTVTLETLEAVVDMNGCHYLLTSHGIVHVTCPSAPIRVTAPLCTVTVHPTTAKVHFVNTGAGTTTSVKVVSTETNLAYTQSSLCPGGGGGSFTNGKYEGAVSTTCTDTDEIHVGCWWTTG